MQRLALYFGCLQEIGHYLHGIPGVPGGTIYPERHLLGFPWTAALLDGGLLNNGKIRDQPDGRIWWTCAGRDLQADLWHAFYWWDRSVDRRGASNSGFYVHGFAAAERTAAFDFACRTWPQVVARQQHPLILQPRRT
jgi:hypothetical protein